MQAGEAGKARGLKERALEELKVYWVITLYLWLFLGLFTVYRRLVVAETGTLYLHYGIALIEAMVIAKVVLIGRLFGFSRRFEDRAIIIGGHQAISSNTSVVASEQPDASPPMMPASDSTPPESAITQIEGSSV